jgi:hypothetical protein
MAKASPLRSELAEGRNALALGRVCALTERFLAEPRQTDRLIEFLWDDDEGVTRDGSQTGRRIFAHSKDALLGLIPEARPKKLRWNLALMVGRFPLTPEEARRVGKVLESWLNDASSIVKTAALQGLADLTRHDPAALPGVLDLLRIQGRSGTPAMRARSRILLSKLEKRSARDGNAAS